VRNIIGGSARTLWKVSSNPGKEDCWVAGISVVNMWSKLYMLVLQCLSNFARVGRVQVNNENPVSQRSSASFSAPRSVWVCLDISQFVSLCFQRFGDIGCLTRPQHHGL
jgi:hypothetical protein